MTDMDYWELARIAECACPDGHDSPGALFLLGIAEASRVDDWRGDDISDAAHMIADQEVEATESRGTYRTWLTFVDLAAWQEDVEDYRPLDGSDLTRCAMVALYVIGRRLAEDLLTRAWNDDDDDGED